MEGQPSSILLLPDDAATTAGSPLTRQRSKTPSATPVPGGAISERRTGGAGLGLKDASLGREKDVGVDEFIVRDHADTPFDSAAESLARLAGDVLPELSMR